MEMRGKRKETRIIIMKERKLRAFAEVGKKFPFSISPLRKESGKKTSKNHFSMRAQRKRCTIKS